MASINQNIVSEINNLSKTSEKMKEFLRWILEFERDHSDKRLIIYKNEVEKKLDELLRT